MKQRENRILERLTRQKRVEVAALAEELGVSQVTVRKDLDALEERGIIRREHGFAALCSENDIRGRLACHYETKRRIAQKAAELVEDGATVMIESGSCCALLAEILADQQRGVTLVTNSAFIAGYVRGRRDPETVLLGGAYQKDSQVMVGPLVKRCAESFCVDRLFLGADGWAGAAGFTNSDQMRAQAVRDMAAQAGAAVVLTESEKFSRRGVVPLELGEKLETVITDEGIPSPVRTELEGRGVSVVTVPAREEGASASNPEKLPH